MIGVDVDAEEMRKAGFACGSQGCSLRVWTERSVWDMMISLGGRGTKRGEEGMARVCGQEDNPKKE